MLFPTALFGGFFALTLGLSWLLMPRPALWKPFILLASLVFYGAADWRFVPLLLGVIVVNQAAALGIAARPGPTARTILVAAIVADLGVLAVFKYLGFLAESVNAAFMGLGLGDGLPVLRLLLPIGISFYIFQAISYVVDVHRHRIAPARWIDFAVFQAFFPHLIAGPIVRASEFIPQLASPRSPRGIPAVPALFLIAGGLVKKLVIADFLATDLVDPVFGAPGSASAVETIAAVYAYAIQIYCDFSGYTDMAIGLAMLLGFWFPQNFDRPYTAASVQDFWRRWHMTLSRWLRDYLYIPLGGSRISPRRTDANLMATMLIGGLWHGASWSFVAWGGLHGAALATERALTARRERRLGLAVGQRVRRWPTWVSVLVVFNFVALTWVLFRAQSLAGAGEVLIRLVNGWSTPTTLVTWTVVVLIGIGLILQWIPPAWWRRTEAGFARLPIVAQGLLLALLAVAVASLTSDRGVAPFIYLQF